MGAASAAAAAGGGGGSGGRLRPSQAVLSAQSVQQASQSSQSASGSREREFKRLVDAAKNCTATVAADETCAGERRFSKGDTDSIFGKAFHGS